MTEVLETTNPIQNEECAGSPLMNDDEIDYHFEIEQEKTKIQYLQDEIQKMKQKISEEQRQLLIMNTKGELTSPNVNSTTTESEQQGAYILSADLIPRSMIPTTPMFDFEDSAFTKDNFEDGLVLYSRNFQIVLKGGTLEKVIERLTSESTPDNELVDTFLLTYRKYLTAEELLEKIWERYEPFSIAELEAMNETDRMNVLQAQKIIRLRVANFVKRWLTNHFHDFVHNPNLCTLLRAKCDETFVLNEPSLGCSLKQTLEGEQVTTRQLMMSEKPPEPIKPKSTLFEDFDPVEVARQLCLFEHSIYSRIHPKECLDQCWSKDGKDENCPNIMKLIYFFNSLSGFVVHTILQYKDVKDRVNVVKKFMRIIQASHEMNNFNACQEIMSGLADSSIFRLRRTWGKVQKDKRLTQQIKEIKDVLNPAQSWKTYRMNLKLVNPPCLPYLGVYLTDLTFIEDGNKNYLPKLSAGREDLINLEKMRKQALVIQDIMLYQQTQYHFEKVPEIYDFFEKYGQPGYMIKLSKEEVNKLHSVSVAIETREEVEIAKQIEAKIAEKEQQKLQKKEKKTRSGSSGSIKEKKLRK